LLGISSSSWKFKNISSWFGNHNFKHILQTILLLKIVKDLVFVLDWLLISSFDPSTIFFLTTWMKLCGWIFIMDETQSTWMEFDFNIKYKCWNLGVHMSKFKLQTLWTKFEWRSLENSNVGRVSQIPQGIT